MDAQAPRDRNDHVAIIMGSLRHASTSDNIGNLRDVAPTDGDIFDDPVVIPPSQVWGGATPLGNTAPPHKGFLGTDLEPTPGLGSTDAALDVPNSSEHQ
eukprot:14309566-Heterocapsa_arctica.AAC.1